jgi:type II secretory pathway pseudopilin PulG
MLHFTKLLICRFRSSLAGKHVVPAKAGIHSANRPNCAVYGLDSRPSASSGQAFRGNDVRIKGSGYALLFVMMAAAVVLVVLTAVLPSVYQEGQREREEELIFRGMQYARAIASFHQKFQRYPTSIQELTKLTNGWRFLRKEFTDPMTSNGKWRFIHVNGQGVLLDSKTQPSPAGGQGQPGAGQGGGGFGMSGPSNMGGSAFGQQGMGGSGFGLSSTGGSAFGQEGMGGSGFGLSTGNSSAGSNSGGSSSNAQQNSAFFSEGNQGGGLYILGVASTSHKPSIRIWKEKTHYDEWEFLATDLAALGIATSIPGLPQGVGGQPGQGGQPGIFGGPPRGNPNAPGQGQGMFLPQGGSSLSPQ